MNQPKVSMMADMEAANRQLRESEATARAFMQTPTDSALLLNHDGVILDLNETAALRLQRYEAELRGRCIYDLFDPKTAARRREHVAFVFASREPVRFEDERDGIWFDTVIYPIIDEGGAASKVAVLARDITTLRRAEEALTEERNLLRTLLEHIPDYIYVKDVEGRYVLSNAAHMKSLGLQSPAEILGKTPSEILGGEVAAIHEEQTRGVLESGLPLLQRVTEAIDPDGARRWHSITEAPLRNANGEITGLVGVTRDITEFKQAREALERQTAELARSNTDLEQFAYVASHDLQEPLRMVSSYLQLLSRRYVGQLDEDADEFIGYAVEGSARMQALINALLEYSRVGTRNVELKATDSQAVLADVLTNLKVALAESQATVTHDALPVVRADSRQFAQLLQNLIGNAVKFRAEQPPRVHIGAERDNGVWRFSVQDNGIGLDEKFAERIFVIFQRLHSRATYAGTGIGLALCKKIVERHGGEIWVESKPGAGATFYFSIPTGQ